MLAGFLPFVKFEEDMREFNLGVNRPKKREDGIVVNEITRWSVLSLLYVAFGAGLEAPQVAESAVRLEFDINNSEDTPVKGDAIAELERLLNRCVEISESGI
ncbi:hypothetical protein D3C80_1537020 [compost metagenome]